MAGLRLPTLLIGAVLLGPGACGGSPAATHPTPSPRVAHITVGGIERTYVVFRPPSLDPKRPVPVVFALHGFTDDATGMEGLTHFDDSAGQAGFEVVYLEGAGSAWNAGSCCGQRSADDVGFMKAMIDRLVSGKQADPKRVFVSGFSNGGMMSQRLACELSDRITAVASVSGSLVAASCSPSRAISVLEMHGVADDIVPYQGGPIPGLGEVNSTMSVMKQWASLDGCAAAPAVTHRGITTTYTWTGCRGGTTVELDAIDGGLHSWFGPDLMAGEPDATAAVWNFFSQAPPLP